MHKAFKALFSQDKRYGISLLTVLADINTRGHIHN